MSDDLQEEWLVPVLGDWVKDKRGLVWRIRGIHKEYGVLCEKRTPSGRKSTSYKRMNELSKLDPALYKLMNNIFEKG